MPSDRLPSPRQPQSAQFRAPAVSLLALLATCAMLFGCAVPGEPIARHPITPEPVTDLVARQQGNTVVLSFTLPKNSTDQQPLGMLPTVEIYRSAAPSPTTAAPTARSTKSAVHPVDTIPSDAINAYQQNGRVELPDPLDAANLALSPGQQLAYFVRTRVSSRRTSANSNAITLPVFPAPQAVGNLRATVAEDATTLTWTAPAPIPAAYRVYRAEVTQPVAQPATMPSTPFQLLGQAPSPEYRDTTIQLDHTYSYIVRSIAQFGAVTVESADSAPLVVLAKDVFPPATPQSLETVIVPATAAAPAYVELAWGISPEPDFAGYVVFRSEQSDTTGERLTPDLLSAPTFRDITVVSGRHYFYRVAAVDRDGNASPLSAAIEADVP